MKRILLLSALTLVLACGAEDKASQTGNSAVQAPPSDPKLTPAPASVDPAVVAAAATVAQPESQNLGSSLVATAADLPTCDPTRKGALTYVKSEGQFYTCDANLWSVVTIKTEKGEKGEAGAAGAAGSPGASGLAIAKYQTMEPGGVNFCTEFSLIERCYFNGGQVLRFSDGTVLITGGWTYDFFYSGTTASDSDTDFAAFTFIASAKSTGSWQRLHHRVARGHGYKSVFLVFDRAADSFTLVHDTNNDGVPGPTDEILKKVVVTND